MLKGCMHLTVKIEYTYLPSLITCLDSVGLAQNDLTFPEIKFIFKGGGLLLLRSFETIWSIPRGQL